MTDPAPLLVHDEGAVRVITLNRPHKKNAFDLALTNALWAALEDVARDDRVRVAVVTGAGGCFSAGADMGVFLALAQGQPQTDVARIGRLHEPLRACPKPLIAAVDGFAVGMGVTMLPHFDMVYASEVATFTTPFVRLGLVVEYGGSFALTHLLGRQRTEELLLRARPLDAKTAAGWGLVTRVFPAGELMASVMQIAAEIAEAPPGAAAETKRLVREGEHSDLASAIAREDEALRSRYASSELLEAAQAFFAARASRP